MSDDDIRRRVLAGSAYEEAEVTVSRMIPLSLAEKIRMAILTLAASAFFAPTVLFRRDFIRTLEEVPTLRLRLGTLAFVGTISTFGAGLLLLRHERVVSQRSLDEEQARRLVRIEDFWGWFVAFGAVMVFVSTGLGVVGVLSPSAIAALYGHGIVVYRPVGTFVSDVRLVSALGGVFAVLLFGIRWLITPDSAAG